MSAAQLNLELSADYETGNYLDSQKWGSFSLLSRLPGATKARQVSYKLSELPRVLSLCTQDNSRDYWISQAVFTKFNRRKVNLAHVGVAFVDLDYYRFPELAIHKPETVMQTVMDHCEAENIPLPSIVIDSGKGLQIKWFHDALPRKALPRWEALQKHLVTRFAAMGGDFNARDVSRVLRVVETTNQKTGRPVRVLWVNTDFDIMEPRRYAFNDLAEKVIPPAKPKHKAKQAGAVITLKKPWRGFTLDTLNWSRLCDLQKLIDLRGGDVGAGMREPMAFWLCNFFALRYSKQLVSTGLDEWNEFRELCLQAAPHWEGAKIREKTSNLYQLTRDHADGKTVTFNGKEYPTLYTPKSGYLIDLFQITDKEQKQLATLIGEDEYRQREKARDKKRKGWKQSREEYEAQSRERREQALKLRAQGMKQKDIAKALGLTPGRVSQLLKKV